jgi:BirA family transcriptional regulator, biotin operon repressor / biotin---[acetyl-CoA-carboxylase] ligase
VRFLRPAVVYNRLVPPFDPASFHTFLATQTFGRNLIFEPSIGSTMDLARDAAARGAPEGTVAFADEQTAGRGRMGRSWMTPLAANLLTTVVLRPPSASVLRQVAMITPLAIADAVADITGIRTDVKWPNDVQVAGKKLAGVLIESAAGDDGSLTALAGAGINVNFDPRESDELRGIATSLRMELGREVDREALLASYLLHFERLYGAAKSGASMRDRWRERLVTLGQRVTVTETSRMTQGVAEDVDADGALLVRRDDGALITVEAGDVTLRA